MVGIAFNIHNYAYATTNDPIQAHINTAEPMGKAEGHIDPHIGWSYGKFCAPPP